jgi:hypothetical protein
MKLYNILLLFVAITIASCNNDTAPHWDDSKHKVYVQALDTIAYTYQSYKSRDKDCGDNPDSTCTIVKFSYPEFVGKKALNDSVTHKFIQLFVQKPDRPVNTYDQLAANFMSSYTYFKRGNPHSTLKYLLDGHAKVLSEDHYLTTVEVSGYSYHGGAHGVDLTGYINWNAKANKFITLDNILYKGAKDTLTGIAERIFRKNEKISDTTSLNNGRTYFFKDGKFALPDTYVLTNYGIKFLYNVYTIKSYAAGKTYITVPYDNIRPLIKPHFGF